MEELKKRILKIKDHVKQINLSILDENQTKQIFINPILHVLGWDIFNPEIVKYEHKSFNQRVDIALLDGGKKLIFIEAKKTIESLEKHEEQLLKYCFQESVPMAILSNGIVWWFYLPRKETTWDKRKFYTIELLEQEIESVVEKFTQLLSYSEVISGKYLMIANNIFDDQAKKQKVRLELPKIWKIILLNPSEDFIKIIKDELENNLGISDREEILQFIYNLTEKSYQIEFENIPQGPATTDKNHDAIIRPPKSLTQDEIIPYIIDIIGQKGGAASKNFVEGKIYRELQNIFSQSYYEEKLACGVTRWEKDVAWAKQRAVDKGLIKKPDRYDRGIWKLTQRGWDEFQRSKDKFISM
ncbi:MAG: hypothetical protein FJW56_05590 [Actinobacteria bacterium]|nr:hypothetical protein [Actinomycetota bacterium]